MWKLWEVKFTFIKPFAASLPRTPEEIAAMLEHRAPAEEVYRARVAAGEQLAPLQDLEDQVAEEMGASEEWQPGWATFKRDDEGIYYEDRCVRGHIKDCAGVVAKMSPVKNFRAKVTARTYVEPPKLRLYGPDGTQKADTEGTETRFIQVMTRQGPRSSVKYVDYVKPPTVMTCRLKVMDDGQMGDQEQALRLIFDYGAVHGMGQERSQQWGQYEYELRAL